MSRKKSAELGSIAEARNVDRKGFSEYNAIVARIRELLGRWLETGVDLFLELRDVDLSGKWKLPGHATFRDFLRAEFPSALGLERYNNVVRAIELHGVDRVRQVGVFACHTLSVDAIAKSAERVELLGTTIDRYVSDHGVPPDANTIRDMARGIAPELVRPHRSTVAALRDLRLAEELKVARARVRELERELAERDKVIAKLRKRLEG